MQRGYFTCYKVQRPYSPPAARISIPVQITREAETADSRFLPLVRSMEDLEARSYTGVLRTPDGMRTLSL